MDELKDLSQNPFGFQIATDVFKLQIPLLLQQIFLLEEQLETVEEEMTELIVIQNHHLTTIHDYWHRSCYSICYYL